MRVQELGFVYTVRLDRWNGFQYGSFDCQGMILGGLWEVWATQRNARTLHAGISFDTAYCILHQSCSSNSRIHVARRLYD